jgi:hypothetical protein
MEDATGLKVDLVVEEAVLLHQFVRDGMVKDLIVLHEDEHIADTLIQMRTPLPTPVALIPNL